ncbi:MAG: hypothetical protein LBD60_03780, partial [Puniceicoccales bacterium]|nr:hypothetical protein [Puniceicoccales bacterium]
MITAIKNLKNDTNYNVVKTTMIDPIYDYVDKYWVHESLYSEWRNYKKDETNIYGESTMVTADKTVTERVIGLQAAYSGWTKSKIIQHELLKQCYKILKGEDLPGASTEEEKTKLKNFRDNIRGSGSAGYTPDTVSKNFFCDLFIKIYDYSVKERNSVPLRCNSILSAASDDFEPLAIRTIRQGDTTTSHVAVFTPVDNVIPFVEPSQGTVPKSHWESAKIVLDNLDVTGEDSLTDYLSKQASELAKQTNRVGKNGFYKIKLLLDEIEAKINVYKVFPDSANRNIAFALTEWYNAVLDYAAQHIKISLQEHINDHLWDATNAKIPYEEIGDATNTAGAATSNSNWKITSSGTMLKYIKLNIQSNNTCTIQYLYPANNPSDLFTTINTLKSSFLDADNKIKDAFMNVTSTLEEIKTLQGSLTNLLQQYNNLTEEQKKGYNSNTIEAYIQRLEEGISDNLCAYNVDTGVATYKITGLPKMTETLLVKCLQQLDNLKKRFESLKITREVNTFYDWFANIEKLYYDWRINSVSRKTLLKQLNLFKGIKFEFELPKSIANEQELTVDNVEIKSSPNMAEMMAKITTAVRDIKEIVNGTVNADIDQSKRTAVEDALTGATTGATAKLEAAKTAGEFRAIDDYFTCKGIIEGLQSVLADIPTSGTLSADQSTALRVKMASNEEVTQMTSNNQYFLTVIINHIGEIEDHIKLYDIEMPKNNNAKEYEKIADRYGFTGDCDCDQIAVIRLMDKIRVTIEDEFRAANNNRGSELLAAKISGRAISFSVDDIKNSDDRMKKYHQCWYDFERYASYLVTNFVHQNRNEKMANGSDDGVALNDCGYATADFGNIAKGTESGGRLLTYYTVSGSGNNSVANRKITLNEACNSFAIIDYSDTHVDFKLDCLKVYKDLFLDGSVFEKIRTYMAPRGAYLAVCDYVNYLFDQYTGWRDDVDVNTDLRKALTDLKGAKLYQQMDLSYKIEGDIRETVSPTGSIDDMYCSHIGATVNKASSNLSDYISILSNNIYGYDAYEDAEAIYSMRLKDINDKLEAVLGSSTYNYTALFNTKSDTLLSGGAIITDDDKMMQLIKQLENVVTGWNRQDAGSTKKIFNELNKDGVYFLQSDNSYVYNGAAVPQTAYPRDGTVKTIAGETTTYEICKDGSVASTETKKTADTVRNRIITNELLSVIDALKNVYLNGMAIRKVGEVYYRLQMAEYVYAMAGKEAKNVTWSASSGTKFLKNNGCYTFRMGDADFICGIQNGEIKIAQLNDAGMPAASNVSGRTTWLAEKEMTWFEEKKNLQGVFYKYTDSSTDPVLTAAEFSITANGKTYYSSGGSFFDSNGTEVGYDGEGFLLDKEEARIVKTVTNSSNSSSYVAYRVDGISSDLLGVDYNPTTKTEIESSSGKLERYGMRFGSHRGMFAANAQYLLDEDTHALFVEEFNTIGTNFGIEYANWKKDVNDELFSNSSKSFSAKIAQFAAMFSSLSDILGRHDVKRYNDKLAYSDEELMLKMINTMIKNFDKSDNDFKNFANIATRGKEYYTILNKIAIAKSSGNIEAANQYITELAPKKRDYENAKTNAAKEKGSFPAYVKSLSKSLSEAASQMKYLLSIQRSPSVRAQLITSYTYSVKRCEVAENILSASIGIDSVGEEVENLVANSGLQKDFANVATLIQNGNSKYSERPVLSLAEIWGVEKDAKMCEYGGWRGDSRDALLYQGVLNEFTKRTYFQKSEELSLIRSDGVKTYITQMGTTLETYIEELKKYEIYSGIMQDVYVLDVIKDGRKCKIAGIGFNEIVKEHANWFIESSRKVDFQAALKDLSADLDLIINSYDNKGELNGQMDAVLLQKIKNFREYLGGRDDTDKKTYIGRVKDFIPYNENKKSEAQYKYKLQSMELNAVIAQYNAKKLDFEEYKKQIDELKQTGPLDDYVAKLRGFLSYSQQLDLYQKSLLQMVPMRYANYRGEWHKLADLSDTQLKETNGSTYCRMIYGYKKNGEVCFIEDYDPNDSITEPVYVEMNSIWHGDYSHYGVMFRLMAILYEKFTTQKNMLEELLKEIQANNEKISEANKYLAKINKVQAQAARQGENARVVIPADVILFFKKNNIPMASEFFGNDADIATYENSNFNKRMAFLEEKNKGVSNILTYLSQGKLKSGDAASSNLMLADLTNSDLLELGSLKEIYDQT